ncbi:hypothetical protein [Roseimaritima sediminicola]|uniref:hypothetical protein n=1 Tax=Roseimaritima sediminicola TaxID=2662066 RepID=UPI001298516D|nr:hypothetical protein [Roseimaritima sediminicola]
MLHDRARSHRGPRSLVASISPRHTLQRSIGIAFATLLFFAAIVISSQLWGQGAQFEVIDIAPEMEAPAAVKAMDRARKEAPRRREAAPGSWPQWSAFSAYYNRYLFPKMTQPDQLTELPKMNQEILKDLRVAQSSGSTQAAKAILDWSVANARKLAQGNYHPAVRVNATLLLGQLDEQASIPPVPAQQAFLPLVSLYRNKSVPDGVRAAALIGLHRWTQFGLPKLNANTRYRDGLVQIMLDLAKEPVPDNRTAEGHAYLQRYALDALRVLYTDAKSKEITDVFVDLSTSPDASPIISLYAAANIAKLGGSAKVESPTDVAKAWAVNASNVFASEHARLLAMTPPKAAASQSGPVQPQTRGYGTGGAPGSAGMEYGMGAGYGGEMMSDESAYGAAGMMDSGMDGYGSDEAGYGMDGMGPGGYGMGPGGYGMGGMAPVNPQPPEVTASRRRLIHALECIKYGLTGSRNVEEASTPAGLQTQFPEDQTLAATQLKDTLLEVLDEVNNTEYDTREKFAEMLISQADNLKTLSTHLGQETPQEAEVEEDSNFPAGPEFPLFGS